MTSRPSDSEVIPKTIQDDATCARRQERHDVAGTHDGIERLVDALRREVEFGEVAHQPGGPGMIDVGRIDQRGVAVDTDHPVTSLEEDRANRARTATRIEDVRLPSHHCVDRSGFAAEVETFSGKVSKALDVSCRMLRVFIDDPRPLAALDHGTMVRVGERSSVSDPTLPSLRFSWRSAIARRSVVDDELRGGSHVGGAVPT